MSDDDEIVGTCELCSEPIRDRDYFLGEDGKDYHSGCWDFMHPGPGTWMHVR